MKLEIIDIKDKKYIDFRVEEFTFQLTNNVKFRQFIIDNSWNKEQQELFIEKIVIELNKTNNHTDIQIEMVLNELVKKFRLLSNRIEEIADKQEVTDKKMINWFSIIKKNLFYIEVAIAIYIIINIILHFINI